MAVPYIGVTDFASHSQVCQALACIPNHVKRRLHVGAMMSYKTLRNIPTQIGWEKIWLDEDGLNALFQRQSNVFNVLHYADYGTPALTTKEDIILACKKGGTDLDGLQFDMIWPKVELLYAVKDRYPSIEIILQVSKKAITEAEQRGESVEKNIEAYADLADYVLLDYSMGRGEIMSAAYMVSYAERIARIVSPNRIAVGGGLGPKTYHLLEPLLAANKDISCDAQGKLRSSGSAVDPIEMDLVCPYIRGVCSLL
jgi:hypothetical protein